MTLSSEFPMGLWHAWAYVHFPLAGIAFPTPEVDPPPLPPGDFGQDDASVTRGADADLAGLRAYQPGDPLQRIAWKSVARGAGWHTKQFEGGSGGGRVALAWDSLPASLPAPRRSARLTAWVLAAERAARPFSLRAPGCRACRGTGARPSPKRADGAGAPAGTSRTGRRESAADAAMRASHLFFKKQRRAPMPPGDDTLSTGQVRWLGALMLGDSVADARVGAVVDRLPRHLARRRCASC